ncbi:MAG: tetratricopeptide repeat protein [Lewinella sp.]|uniref:tetratricopeptide repeat protein n=1 Tax=Lewinella sp. TaxID=2004506 RepID=UPI003D6A9D3A
MIIFKGLLLVVLLLVTSIGEAQRPAALLRKGDQAMAQEDYYTALHYFRQALERKPAPDIRFRLAESALAFQAFEAAEEHYLEITESTAIQQYPTAWLGLGLAYQSQGKYSDAINALNTFIATGKGSTQQQEKARTALLSSSWAEAQTLEEEWTLDRLPRRINSPYGEFGAWKSGDTLFYTSYRYEKEDDKYEPARKISKVMFSRDDRRGRVMSRGFNEDTIHTAHTALSRDKQLMFFNRCQFTEGAAISCQLYTRERDRRGRWERGFSALPAAINTPRATATQPTLMWDSIAQQEYLLFVSKRPGGSGDFDLWQVALPNDDGKWGEPSPIAALNTAYGEVSPQFHEASQTLYFSTNRPPGFGGYDLVKVPYLGNDEWGAVENLGLGINSSYDDTYPFFTKPEVAYFSSNRPGGRYLDPDTKNCCPDIFKAKLVPPPPSDPVDTNAIVRIDPIKPEPTIPTRPIFRNLEDFLPLTLFYDNDHPNPRTRKSVTDLNYSETYFNYLKREDAYYEQYAENEEEQDAVALFFEKEVVEGYERLDLFSTILLEQLEAEQEVEIFLKGYTSPRAKGDYNLLLGKRRVSAVRNHFQNWRAGVLLPYLESGQLVISEVSFGETKAAASAQDERAGERLSIYSPAAARERRVEIVEVKQQ